MKQWEYRLHPAGNFFAVALASAEAGSVIGIRIFPRVEESRCDSFIATHTGFEPVSDPRDGRRRDFKICGDLEVRLAAD